jgi:hypothetical protein
MIPTLSNSARRWRAWSEVSATVSAGGAAIIKAIYAGGSGATQTSFFAVRLARLTELSQADMTR